MRDVQFFQFIDQSITQVVLMHFYYHHIEVSKCYATWARSENRRVNFVSLTVDTGICKMAWADWNAVPILRSRILHTAATRVYLVLRRRADDTVWWSQ